MSSKHSSDFFQPQGAIWYLLYCKAKEEARAVMHLANQGVTAFYPQAAITKIRRNKRTEVIEPLFPNYVFAQLDVEQHNFASVKNTRGVIGFVKHGAHYQIVPDALIAEFEARQVAQPMSDNAMPSPGDKVIINNAQYNNIEAIYQEAKGEQRAVLLLELINKPVKVIFENSEFEKL